MKHIVVAAAVLLLVPLYVADVNYENEAERQILEFFSKWRTGDTLPFPLPPLDLIVIPPLNGSYSGNGVKLNYSSSELRLTGVDKFSVTKLTVSLPALRASGSLYIPTLTITADSYELQGKAFYVYSLKGAGKLDVSLYGVIVQFDIRLARNGGGSRVIEIQLDFAIEDIQANLENSSWPINKMLNTEGVKILEGYHEEIVAATRTSLVDTFDGYLVDKTPDQLLEEIETKDNLVQRNLV